MRYIDENGNFIPKPDPSSGLGEEKQIFIAHHDAEEEVPDIGHYKVVAEYPNGGKDVEWIVDVPGRPYIPAWDEYETVILWHFFKPPSADRNYTAGELATIDGVMYEILTSIPAGVVLVERQNVHQTTIEEQLEKLKEQT